MRTAIENNISSTFYDLMRPIVKKKKRTCISCRNGDTVSIRYNRITLETGLGRGSTHGPYGDMVVGIDSGGAFPGGLEIRDNHLDFALSRAYGGFIPPGLREDPGYRPDLRNHEYYIGCGVMVSRAVGRVSIEGNVIRNMNALGITATQNHETADVRIEKNILESGVYGAYYYDPRWAGYGIIAHSAWAERFPGFHVEISDNEIGFDKLHFNGVGIFGPVFAPEGSGKLTHGYITNNKIRLSDGTIGIHVECCDGFKVTNNEITGKVYYGIGVFPRGDPDREVLGAHGNHISGTIMDSLEIKVMDEYVRGIFDTETYPGSRAGQSTAHVWLGENTSENRVEVGSDESVADEGMRNEIVKKKEN